MLAKYTFYYFILALALVSWWLSKLTVSETTQLNEIPAYSPDYFSYDYVKTEMDNDGVLKSEVKAEKVTHFNSSDEAVLEKLIMTIYKPDSPPWVIRSETGTVPAGGRDIYLNGKVFIDRAKAQSKNEIKIITSNLRVKPEQDYAETDEWADLIMPPNKTSGTGMEVTFSTPIHLKLLANVRGRYE